MCLLSENSDFIQTDVQTVSDLPTVYIIDAMAFIQSYQHMGAKTFGDLAQRYLVKIIKLAPYGCNEIHFIGDRYDFDRTQSVKHDERMLHRKSSQHIPEYVPAENVDIPDWKSLMANNRSKVILLDFLSQTLIKNGAVMIPQGTSLVHGGTCIGKGKATKLGRQAISN